MVHSKYEACSRTSWVDVLVITLILLVTWLLQLMQTRMLKIIEIHSLITRVPKPKIKLLKGHAPAENSREKNPSLLHPSFCWLSEILNVSWFALWFTPISASTVLWPSSLCLCVSISLNILLLSLIKTLVLHVGLTLIWYDQSLTWLHPPKV
jgi:hypothetical protein